MGEFHSENPNVIAMANGQALAEGKLLEKIYELDYEQFEQGMNDDGE